MSTYNCYMDGAIVFCSQNSCRENSRFSFQGSLKVVLYLLFCRQDVTKSFVGLCYINYVLLLMIWSLSPRNFIKNFAPSEEERTNFTLTPLSGVYNILLLPV